MSIDSRTLILQALRWFTLALLIAFWSVPLPSEAAEEGCRTKICHRGEGQGEVTHDPVLHGECRSCHRGGAVDHPDREGEEFGFVFDGGADLCHSCHSALRDEMEKAVSVHPPSDEGKCLTCHIAHSSDFGNLLRRFYPDDSAQGNPLRIPFERGNFALCWECHDVYGVLMPKTMTKTAFRSGGDNLHYRHLSGEKAYTCSACHPAHYSGSDGLVGRMSAWGEDFVNFTPSDRGGSCAPGCHVPRSYLRE